MPQDSLIPSECFSSSSCSGPLPVPCSILKCSRIPGCSSTLGCSFQPHLPGWDPSCLDRNHAGTHPAWQQGELGLGQDPAWAGTAAGSWAGMQDEACVGTPLCLGWDWGRIQLLLWLPWPSLHGPSGYPLVCPSSSHQGRFHSCRPAKEQFITRNQCSTFIPGQSDSFILGYGI